MLRIELNWIDVVCCFWWMKIPSIDAMPFNLNAFKYNTQTATFASDYDKLSFFYFIIMIFFGQCAKWPIHSALFILMDMCVCVFIFISLLTKDQKVRTCMRVCLCRQMTNDFWIVALINCQLICMWQFHSNTIIIVIIISLLTLYYRYIPIFHCPFASYDMVDTLRSTNSHIKFMCFRWFFNKFCANRMLELRRNEIWYVHGLNTFMPARNTYRLYWI